MLQRIPPQNIEAEMAVLGAMLLGDRAAIEKATEVLTKDDFYREAHSRIFESMVGLTEKDEPVDIVTLKNELARSGRLEAVGGLPYLMQVGDFVPTAVNVTYYAKIVAEKAVLRRLIETSSEIANMAYGEVEEVDHLVDHAERSIFNVARRRRNDGFTELKPLLSDTFERIDTLYHERGVTTGVDTGFNDLNYMTSGFQGGDLIILAARPSMGKCLKFDALIDDPRTGRRRTIQECVEAQLPLVSGLTDCGTVAPAAISHWIGSGVKPVWRVTTRLGRRVEVTGHHPFRTPLGWQPLHDLQVGDAIAVPRRLPIFGHDDQLAPEVVRLIAYFIAEGGLTGTTPAFTNTDPEIVADFESAIAKHFPTCVIRQREITYHVVRPTRSEWLKTPNPVTEWLRELGLWGKLADSKAFPAVVWEWTESLLGEFLRALFSCDGTIYSLAGHARIEFAVASKALATDVQHALVRFGIVSKLWQKSERCWRVEITGVEDVERFQQAIGWIGEKSRREFAAPTLRRSLVGNVPATVWTLVREAARRQGLSLSELARRSGEVCNSGYNPHTGRGITASRLRRYAETLDDDRLRALASPDIFWDRIESIEAIGEHRVFDLTVPSGANFIADDVCVHNTSLALTIGQNAALKSSVVAVFSLEMSKESLAQRMICSEARVDAHRLRTGYLQEDDWSKLAVAVNRLWECNLFIDDATDLSALEMRAKCRRLRAEKGALDMIIVDYLQLMRGSSKNSENRNQEITEIARGLKSLARELQVPVIALSQLSRSVERREDKRPMLSDLRESGAIEAEADLVMFIYRPSYYARKEAMSAPDGGEGGGGNSNHGGGSRPSGNAGGYDAPAPEGAEPDGEEAEVIIAKQRNGPTGTVKMAFIPKFARFENLATFTEDNPF